MARLRTTSARGGARGGAGAGAPRSTRSHRRSGESVVDGAVSADADDRATEGGSGAMPGAAEEAAVASKATESGEGAIDTSGVVGGRDEAAAVDGDPGGRDGKDVADVSAPEDDGIVVAGSGVKVSGEAKDGGETAGDGGGGDDAVSGDKGEAEGAKEAEEAENDDAKADEEAGKDTAVAGEADAEKVAEEAEALKDKDKDTSASDQRKVDASVVGKGDVLGGRSGSPSEERTGSHSGSEHESVTPDSELSAHARAQRHAKAAAKPRSVIDDLRRAVGVVSTTGSASGSDSSGARPPPAAPAAAAEGSLLRRTASSVEMDVAHGAAPSGSVRDDVAAVSNQPGAKDMDAAAPTAPSGDPKPVPGTVGASPKRSGAPPMEPNASPAAESSEIKPVRRGTPSKPASSFPPRRRSSVGSDHSLGMSSAVRDQAAADVSDDPGTDEEEQEVQRRQPARAIPSTIAKMKADFEDYSDNDFRLVKVSDIRIMDRTTRKVTEAGVAKYVAAFRGPGYRGFFGTVSVCHDPTRRKKWVLIDGGHRLSAMQILLKEKHPNARDSMKACLITRVDKAPMTELDAIKLGAMANDVPTEAIAMTQSDHLNWARSFIFQFNNKFGNEAMDLKTNVDDLSKQVIALGVAPKASSVNADGVKQSIGVASVTKLMKLALLAEEDADSVDFIQSSLTRSKSGKGSGSAFSLEGLASPSLIYMPDIASEQKSRMRLFMLHTAWAYTGGRDEDGKARRLKGGRDGRFYAHLLHFIRVVIVAVAKERSARKFRTSGSRSSEGAIIDSETTAMDILEQTRPRSLMSLGDELSQLFIQDWTPTLSETKSGKGARHESALVASSVFCCRHLPGWKAKVHDFVAAPVVPSVTPSKKTKSGGQAPKGKTRTQRKPPKSSSESSESGGESSSSKYPPPPKTSALVTAGNRGGKPPSEGTSGASGGDGGEGGDGGSEKDADDAPLAKRPRPKPGALKVGDAPVMPKRSRKRSRASQGGAGDDEEEDGAAELVPRPRQRRRLSAFVKDLASEEDTCGNEPEETLPRISAGRAYNAGRLRRALLSGGLPAYAVIVPEAHQSYDFIDGSFWDLIHDETELYLIRDGLVLSGLASSAEEADTSNYDPRELQVLQATSVTKHAATLIERGWVILEGASKPGGKYDHEGLGSPVHSILRSYAKTIPNEHVLATGYQARGAEKADPVWKPIQNIDKGVLDAKALADGQGRFMVRSSHVRSQDNSMSHAVFEEKLKADLLLSSMAFQLVRAVQRIEGRSGQAVKIRAPASGCRMLMTTKSAPRQRPHLDSRLFEETSGGHVHVPAFGVPVTSNFFVLASGADPFSFCVWPGSVLAMHRLCQGLAFDRVIPMEVIEVPPYSILFCRGDLVHAGAAGADGPVRDLNKLAYSRSMRVHMYLQDPSHPFGTGLHAVSPHVFQSFHSDGTVIDVDSEASAAEEGSN